MKDQDFTFAETTVTCDAQDCPMEETVDGFDGRPLPYFQVNEELRDRGWSVKKIDGEWFDLCPDCSETGKLPSTNPRLKSKA